MRRILLTPFLLCLFLFVGTSAFADDYAKINGIWYDLHTIGHTATVISSGDGDYSGIVNIPATVAYDGSVYTVTSIDEYAFGVCLSITTIISQNATPPVTEGAGLFGKFTYENATLYVPIGSKNAIYTFDGKRLSTTNTADLPKGIYVVNGKKVVVK